MELLHLEKVPMSSSDHNWIEEQQCPPFLAPWALQHVLRWENIKKKLKVFHIIFSLLLLHLVLAATLVSIPKSLPLFVLHPSFGWSLRQTWKDRFRGASSSIFFFYFFFFLVSPTFIQKFVVETLAKLTSPLPPPPLSYRGRSWMRTASLSFSFPFSSLPPPH